jgi:hypothetical protein
MSSSRRRWCSFAGIEHLVGKRRPDGSEPHGLFVLRGILHQLSGHERDEHARHVDDVTGNP